MPEPSPSAASGSVHWKPGDLCPTHPDHYEPCSKCAGADCCEDKPWPCVEHPTCVLPYGHEGLHAGSPDDD